MKHYDLQGIGVVPTPDERSRRCDQILAAARHFAHYLRINPNKDYYIVVSWRRCPVRIKDPGKLIKTREQKKHHLAKGAEPYT